MLWVEGETLDFETWRFNPIAVGIEAGVVERIERKSPTEPIAKGVVLPLFFNLHTHIGDSIIKGATGGLDELVGPHGVKFQALSQASPTQLVNAMRETIDELSSCGTALFCDFREGGSRGIELLEKALSGKQIECIKLGRPTDICNKKEIDKVLEVADGIGISSISDYPYPALERLAKRCHKMFALHASEGKREDIDKILDLEPDLLIHLTKATDEDLERVAAEKVPVVVCPRASLFFGELIDLGRMLNHGLSLMLGTDNRMINHVDLLTELEVAYKLSKLKTSVESTKLLSMAFLAPRKILNKRGDITIREGEPARFMVLRSPPSIEALMQCNAKDIALVVNRTVRRYVCIER